MASASTVPAFDCFCRYLYLSHCRSSVSWLLKKFTNLGPVHWVECCRRQYGDVKTWSSSGSGYLCYYSGDQKRLNGTIKESKVPLSSSSSLFSGEDFSGSCVTHIMPSPHRKMMMAASKMVGNMGCLLGLLDEVDQIIVKSTEGNRIEKVWLIIVETYMLTCLVLIYLRGTKIRYTV
ncbi:hypothetical protein SDJN02_09079, partial [Cucurbita argyrosperma subsp. argyrosperma]